MSLCLKFSVAPHFAQSLQWRQAPRNVAPLLPPTASYILSLAYPAPPVLTSLLFLEPAKLTLISGLCSSSSLHWEHSPLRWSPPVFAHTRQPQGGPLWASYLLLTYVLSLLGISDLPLSRSTFLSFKDFTYLFLERGEDRGKEREKHWCARETLIGCLLHSPTGDLAQNPDMCPDWELNQWPFGLWDDMQPTEPHESILYFVFWHRFSLSHTRYLICPFYLNILPILSFIV